MRKFSLQIINFPKKLVLLLIKAYQVTFSPDHGLFKGKYPYGFCRHYPSCSEYSRQAVEKFGFFKGLKLGLLRVVKCHPWAEPKIDPVPNH